MKNLFGYLVVTTCITFLFLWFFLPSKTEKLALTVKPGQMWVYCYSGENPFTKEHKTYNKVINVKDGYVQYVRDGRDTNSCKIQWFLIDSKLLNEPTWENTK